MLTLFGIYHFIYILLIVFVGVGFYLLIKDRSAFVQRIAMICLISVTLIIMTYEMFRFVPTEGWSSVLRDLPLFQCDINAIVIFVVLLMKKRHIVLEKFVLYYGLVSPIFSILIPQGFFDVYMFYEYPVWSLFLKHGCLVITQICYLKLFAGKLPSTKPWQQYLVQIGLMGVAHVVNLILIRTGAYPAANYSFTILPVMDNVHIWHASVTLGYNVWFIRCFIQMCTWYNASIAIGLNTLHKLTETDVYARTKIKLKDKWEQLKAKIFKKKAA